MNIGVILGVSPKIIPLVIGVANYKRLSFPFRCIHSSVVCGLLCELYGYYLGAVLHQNNWWLFNLYNFFEIFLMGGAAVALARTRKLKITFILGVIACFVIGVWEQSVRATTDPNNITIISYSALLSALYLTLLFTNSLFIATNLAKQPIFWIAISSIIYYSCSIPYMGLTSYLYKSFPSLSLKLLLIMNALSLLRYSMIAVAFYLVRRFPLSAKSVDPNLISTSHTDLRY